MGLTEYLNSFTLQGPTGRLLAGLPIDLAAVPTLPFDLPTFEVISGHLDLDVVLKHVQLPTDGLIPWPAPATPTVASITSGLSSVPTSGNLEGWVGKIQGTMPVGVKDIADQLKVTATWSFTNLATNQVAEATIISAEHDSPSVTIVLPPILTDLTTLDFDQAINDIQNSPDLANLVTKIGVRVTLTATFGSATAGPVVLPSPESYLELNVVPIPLPSIAALFRDEDLAGDAVLLMVPANSPITDSAKILPLLSKVQALVDRLDTAASLVSWVAGVHGLKSAVDGLVMNIPLMKHIGFKRFARHHDLGHYNFIVRNNHWDTDIEDRGSSALIVSATRDIHFFEHNNYDGDSIRLEPVPSGLTRFGGVVVRRLHSTVPASEPPGCAPVTGAPGGSTGWGDVISSYKWIGG